MMVLQEVKDRGNLEESYHDAKRKLEDAAARLQHMEELVQAKDQALQALHLSLRDSHGYSTASDSDRRVGDLSLLSDPGHGHGHSHGHVHSNGHGGESLAARQYLSPGRPASAGSSGGAGGGYRFYSLLSIPQSPGLSSSA
jgi:hypothetical protein